MEDKVDEYMNKICTRRVLQVLCKANHVRRSILGLEEFLAHSVEQSEQIVVPMKI